MFIRIEHHAGRSWKQIRKKEKKKVENMKKKCKYFNKGHCKIKSDCKFSHPNEICQIYLAGEKCDQKSCNNRHPKVCKWLQGRSGCRRQFPLAPMGVLAPGSAHARPSARPPIDTTGNFPAHVSAESLF